MRPVGEGETRHGLGQRQATHVEHGSVGHATHVCGLRQATHVEYGSRTRRVRHATHACGKSHTVLGMLRTRAAACNTRHVVWGLGFRV